MIERKKRDLNVDKNERKKPRKYVHMYQSRDHLFVRL